MEQHIEQVVYFEAVCINCLAIHNTRREQGVTRPQFIAQLEAEGWEAKVKSEENGEQLFCPSCK